MGQEQSYAHASGTRRRYTDADDYRHGPDYRDYYDSDYKRHRARRSADSFKSDLSSAESSGYRSGSNSAYEYRSASERSHSSDYCRLSLYKNDHYKDVNKELYRPVKIPKEKRYKLALDIEKGESIKSNRSKQSYLSDTERGLKTNSAPTKKVGIRNYTPKILTEEDQNNKKLDSWM
ncbi:uncharacterized protein LOC125488518 [Plutella xylostella]|uniref:uncharacterized protein LOC125488518 n=1 Tax=Plutella xylostella TaxID=51655 RepID=UPI002032D96C|nr:uncharacterized protein LOC125488518 [Plutella xylostella]XP_048482214.1 uncharacterized protein LOC125488518 [Plutella xylostella]